MKNILYTAILLLFLTSCLHSQGLSEQLKKTTYSKDEVDSLALVYTRKGNAKDDIGDKQGAIEYYTKAIKIAPNYAVAYYNRAIVRLDMDDIQGAIKDYTKAIELSPTMSEAYYGRAAAKSALGNDNEAIKDYNQAIDINSAYTSAYFSRGKAKSDLGDIKGALADYNKAIEIDPAYTKAYINRAVRKEKMGDQEGAIADYKLAIRNCAPDFAVYNNLGRVLYDIKRFKEAAEAYGEGIKHFPNDYKLYYGRGLARHQYGDKEGACEDWHKSSELGCAEADELLPLCTEQQLKHSK